MSKNIFEDSWVYKKWVEDGRRQGIRESTVALVQKHFPALTPLAQERVMLLQTSEQLQGLLLKIACERNEQVVRHILLGADNKGECEER